MTPKTPLTPNSSARKRRMSVESQSFALKDVFRIARGSKQVADVVTVLITSESGEKSHNGKGECVPYARYGETIASVIAQIKSVESAICAGADRQALLDLLPAGAARCALDCALWDLAAKQAGQRAWELINQPEPSGLTTAFTISYDTPEVMEEKARQAEGYPLLKIKLASFDDLTRLKAVRRGAPKSALIVDANEGWDMDGLAQMMPALLECGVAGIEQPLPAGSDAVLAGFRSPIPLIADESVHGLDTLDDIAARYQMVNIKLDKTGGLTAALLVKQKAQALGLGIMIGCMVGSSRSMAPAMMLGQGADFIDLDGPLLLAEDVQPALDFKGAVMGLPARDLWG